MKRTYQSCWKVFVSLPFWETCSNYEWEYVILGFACSYSAENRSLILSRGLDFVGNIMLNFFKDSGDQEQSSFPKNNNTTLKRFLLHYLLQFANGLFILDFAVVSCIRLSFHRTYRTFYSDALCSFVNYFRLYFSIRWSKNCFAPIHISSILIEFVSICFFFASI